MAMTATDVYLSKAIGSDLYGGSEETLLSSGIDATVAGIELQAANISTHGHTILSTRVYIVAGSVGAAAGWYTIVGINGDDAIELDRAPGNSAGDVDWYMGGPLLGSIDLATAIADGDFIHIKDDGDYTPGAQWDFSALTSIVIAGYLEEKLDGLGEPDIDFTGAAATAILVAAEMFLFRLDLVSATDQKLIRLETGDMCLIRKCKLHAAGDDVAATGTLVSCPAGSYIRVEDTEAEGPALLTSYSVFGVDEAGSFVNVKASCSKAGANWTGFNLPSYDVSIRGCEADGAGAVAAKGIRTGTNGLATDCVVHDCATDGFTNMDHYRCTAYNNGTNFNGGLDLGGNLEAVPFEIAITNETAFTLYRGDTPTLVITVVDEDGEVIPLVGKTLTLGCKADLGDPDYLFSKVDSDFDKTQDGDGIVKVDLVAGDLVRDVTSAFLELQGTWDGRTRTLLRASLTIVADVVYT